MLHTWPTPERLRQLRRRALVTQAEVERHDAQTTECLCCLVTGTEKPAGRRAFKLCDRKRSTFRDVDYLLSHS